MNAATETVNKHKVLGPKEHHATVLRSVIGSIAAAIPIITIGATVVWKYMLAPILVTQVSAAMAQDIQQKINQTVAAQVQPLNSGFEAVIMMNISQLEADIANLEYIRDFMPDAWTSERVQQLVRKHQQLDTQQQALKQLQARD